MEKLKPSQIMQAYESLANAKSQLRPAPDCFAPRDPPLLLCLRAPADEEQADVEDGDHAPVDPEPAMEKPGTGVSHPPKDVPRSPSKGSVFYFLANKTTQYVR